MQIVEKMDINRKESTWKVKEKEEKYNNDHLSDFL